MNYLTKITKSLGSVVDTAVPAGVGNRTSFAVLTCAVLQYAGPLVPPPYAALVPIVQSLLCGATPLLALAHVVR